MPTEKEWSSIKKENSLGPQIGGLIHDSVAIVTALMNKDADLLKDGQEIEASVKSWLDTLYEIAEAKKKSILKDSLEEPNKQAQEVTGEIKVEDIPF